MKSFFAGGFFYILLLSFAIPAKKQTCFAKGKPVTLAGLVHAKAEASSNGRRFCITGYAYIDSTNGMHEKDGAGVEIKVFTEPEGQGQLITTLPVATGYSFNGLQMAANGVVLYDNQGQPHEFADELRFSFTLLLQTDQLRTRTRSYYMMDGRLVSEIKQVYPSAARNVRIDPVIIL